MTRYFFLFITVLSILACNRNNKIFERIPSTQSGVTFINSITENDSINIMDLEYVYNGGGVAIADFNNDSLPDIFFTANMQSGKLFLNEGKLHFKDVSQAANISTANKWSTGVAAVDINHDGLMDIYVCSSIKKNGADRANMLFINKGVNKDGIPQFVDEAAAYHIADTSYSTNAAFFDYDNDGDLDLYILTNKMSDEMNPNQYKRKAVNVSTPLTDKLYRNDWDSTLNHPVFTDVSAEAGILVEGYGLGLNISDINKDGWKDVYITNDFLTNDVLWINNGNGTFTNRASEYLKHTSYSAMGNDITDINNDGLADIIAMDMLPQYNYRKKMMMSANTYQNNLNNEEYNYDYQYGRNTLQLNRGNAVVNDSITHPVFSEIGFFAGVAETDWSWTPVVNDFDNDGYRDIIVTNGFPKDITDHDFMVYRVNATNIAPKKEILEQIPEVKLHNYAFRNNHDCTFSNVTKDWGLEQPTFSNGAVYADLDKDGDLDVVINNINDEASIYENHSRDTKKNEAHYLQIKFQGDRQNPNGIGTWVELHYDHGKQQVFENSPYRGYLSTVENIAHFGLGTVSKVDSVTIIWPNGRMQLLKNVNADQAMIVNIKNADQQYHFGHDTLARNALFTDVAAKLNIHYKQQEIDFTDFAIQKILPHKLSEYGPGLAVGDVDGNGLDDIICGGSYSFSPSMLLQQADGKFNEKQLINISPTNKKTTEDMGVLLFDADGDHDLDLYIASGSYENRPNSIYYSDRFFVNDGKGNFIQDSTAIPRNLTSKSCVRAADFDKDGDLDLFVAGRVEPWNYPKAVSSFIYRNDSKDGVIKFTDVTDSVAKDLVNIGLTCDAVWTDFDNDGWQDLVLVGEWMNIVFLKNDKGVFKNVSAASNISASKGWWTSIVPGDFDNDGDIDYVVGNVGTNTLYKGTPKYPAKIYAKDFDNNGSYDAVASLYFEVEDGSKREYSAQTRDDLIKQMIGIRRQFPSYKSFANATMNDIFSKEDLKGALILEANEMRTCLLKNNGKGSFEMIPLPEEAQFSSVNGMVVEDFDGDGNLDIAMNGNDYGTEVSVGRYDALNGLFLKGKGDGTFTAWSIEKSGLYIPGNGKALVKAKGAGNNMLLVGSQNRGPLAVFKVNQPIQMVPLMAEETSAVIKYKNGKSRKDEFAYGSSFLSQSGRFLNVGNNIASIEISDASGKKRNIDFK